MNTREEFEDLFGIYLPIGLAIFAIVVLVVVFVVWRFHSRSDELPQGRHESHAEKAYAVVVAAIVAVLIFLTFQTMDAIEPASDAAVGDGPLVNVEAARWNWRFEYPQEGIAVQGTKRRTPTLVVPADTPVRFRQTSIDVIHSFWIPQLRFKRDAFPGRTTAFTLVFPERGLLRHGGECAEFCGLDHAVMSFHVRVLGQDEFRDWVERRAS